MLTKDYRIEKDSMGEMRVPAHAYWGAQTQRAVENFPISGQRFSRPFIEALGLIKACAAEVNGSLGLLDGDIAGHIIAAAHEVIIGKFDDHFVIDIYQTGSATSTNMNANEVIANRANELAGGRLGARYPVHPNDHVNRGQSSNDVIPTALHLATLSQLRNELVPALLRMRESLAGKSKEFMDVLKIGRTHLQDATPLSLGQEFSGYASMIDHGLQRLMAIQPHLGELALGGTAIGTGINTDKRFAGLVIAKLNARTGLQLTEAENHFEAQGARDAIVETSAMLKTLAVSLTKIANDIRWLGSGPRCGIGELRLPEVQPGSSIMPGKINPVIAEALLQVCARVIGNDTTIAISGLSGNFELNVMMPIMTHAILESISLLTRAINVFIDKLLDGLQANKERCLFMVEQSLAMITALVPVIGYDTAADIAHRAFETGETVREILLREKILSAGEIARFLDPKTMV